MRRTSFFAPLLVLASYAHTQEMPTARAEVLQRVTDIVKNRAFVPGIDLGKWDAIVAADKPTLSAAKTDEEFVRDMNLDLRKMGASHFTLLTPKQNTTRTTLRTVGIGVMVGPVTDGLRVVSVFPGSPAEKAGIKAEDVILKLDGKAATRDALQGDEGKKVMVLVKGKKEQTLTYAAYSTRRPITLTKVDESTMLFRLPTFSNGYDRAEVEKLITEAAKSPNLIIDVRNNGGGAVASLQHLMGLFMDSDHTVGTFVTKPLVTAYGESTKKKGVTDPVTIANWSRYAPNWSARQIRPTKHEGGPIFKGNVVVLVNRGSASASEIFASAMHDVYGADVIGTKSMGAVLVALFQPVSNGFSLEFPTSDYVTVRNRRLEANPIEPSVEDLNPLSEVVKATYILHRAQLRKARFGG